MGWWKCIFRCTESSSVHHRCEAAITLADRHAPLSPISITSCRITFCDASSNIDINWYNLSRDAIDVHWLQLCRLQTAQIIVRSASVCFSSSCTGTPSPNVHRSNSILQGVINSSRKQKTHSTYFSSNSVSIHFSVLMLGAPTCDFDLYKLISHRMQIILQHNCDLNYNPLINKILFQTSDLFSIKKKNLHLFFRVFGQ